MRQLFRLQLFDLFAICAFIVISVTFLIPVIPFAELRSNIPIGDARLNFWALSWEYHALFTNPSRLFHGNAFYPSNQAIAFSEHMFTLVLLLIPINWFTGMSLLSYNLLLLLSYPFTALATYVFLKKISGSLSGAFIGSTIFTFNWYRTIHAYSRIQLVHLEWIPLTLYFLWSLKENNRIRSAVGFSFCTVLAILTSWYNALFLMIILSIITIWWWIAHELSMKVALKLLISGILIGLVTVPFALPYLHFSNNTSTSELYAYSLLPGDYITPPYGILWNKLLDTSGALWFEQCLFIGFFPLLLLGLSLFLFTGKEYRLCAPFIVTGAIGFICSMGMTFRDNPAGFKLPYYYLIRLLPDLSFIRVPARYGLLLFFAIAVIVCFGVKKITQRWKCNQLLLTLIWIPLLLVDQLPLLRLPSSPVGEWVEDKWLKSFPPETAIAYIPDFLYSDYWWINADYMLHAAFHGLPIANGYSRFISPTYSEIAAALNAFPEEQAIGILRTYHIDFIVVHFDRIMVHEINNFMERYANSPQAGTPMEAGWRFNRDFLSVDRPLSIEAYEFQERLRASGYPVFLQFESVWIYNITDICNYCNQQESNRSSIK